MESYNRLDRVAKYIQENVSKELQMHQFRILLLIGKRSPEPVAYPDIMKEMNLSSAAVSRNMRLLGTLPKKKGASWVETGHGLVDIRPDPYEPRRNVATFSDKGRKMMSHVAKLMKSTWDSVPQVEEGEIDDAN